MKKYKKYFNLSDALRYAVENGQIELVKELLDKGADIQQRTAYDQTLLMLAISAEQLELTRFLINKGIDPNVHNKYNSALSLAIDYEQPEIVELLLKNGATISYAEEHDEETMFSLAVEGGNPKIVKLLHAHGADINQLTYDGDTALEAALEQGHDDLAIWLIEQGIEIDETTAENGCLPLCEAINKSKFNLMRAMLKDDIAAKQLSPEHHECFTHHFWHTDVLGLLQFLLAESIDIQPLINKNNKLLLAAVRSYKRLDLVKFLIEQGVDINSQDNHGITALMVAAYHDQVEIIPFLLDNGAKVDIKAANGMTAKMYAIDGCQIDSFELLQQYDSSSCDVEGTLKAANEKLIQQYNKNRDKIMTNITFPIKDHKFPKGRKCPICGNSLSEGQVILTSGEQTLDLVNHFHDENKHDGIDFAQSNSDVTCCSKDCMKQLLMAFVDQIED